MNRSLFFQISKLQFFTLVGLFEVIYRRNFCRIHTLPSNGGMLGSSLQCIPLQWISLHRHLQRSQYVVTRKDILRCPYRCNECHNAKYFRYKLRSFVLCEIKTPGSEISFRPLSKGHVHFDRFGFRGMVLALNRCSTLHTKAMKETLQKAAANSRRKQEK